MSYDLKRACVLIVRDGCDVCREIIGLVHEHIEDGKIVVYRVFQSRVEKMWEIRAVGKEIEGLPTLLSSDQIQEVPILYDPILDDMVIGAEEIEEYLEDTGLLDE